MVRRILAAVDGSLRAAGVVDTALDVAQPCGATVHLFRVVPPASGLRFVGNDSAEHDEEQLLAQAAADLEALARGRPRVQVEPPRLDAHEPWRVILDEGRRLSADLIVVGSHGYHGWERLLGTLPARLVEHADRHVLVVHQAPPEST